jgi:hypothetical protein
MAQPVIIVCARFATIEHYHPQQKELKCHGCGELSVMWPSAQAALAKYPEARIICTVCAHQTPLQPNDRVMPAADGEKFAAEMAQARPIGRA